MTRLRGWGRNHTGAEALVYRNAARRRHPHVPGRDSSGGRPAVVVATPVWEADDELRLAALTTRMRATRRVAT